MKLSRTSSIAIAAALTLTACAAGTVTLPHQATDFGTWIEVKYQPSTTEVLRGDTLLVFTELTNVSSKSLRLYPQFGYRIARTEVDPALNDSLRASHPVYVRCSRSGEVSFRVDGVRVDGHKQAMQSLGTVKYEVPGLSSDRWVHLEPGESVRDTVRVAELGADSQVRPARVLIRPSVSLGIPVDEENLPNYMRRYDVAADSLWVELR